MLAPMRQPVPLRPDPSAIYDDGMRSLSRAAIASARAALSGNQATPGQILRTTWGDDRVAALVLRSPTTPTGTDSVALQSVAVALLANLVPLSAAADLIARGLQLAFGNAGLINVPALALLTADFVGERKPYPVAQGTSSATTLSPHKIGVITELTREMIEGSNAEQMVQTLLIENIGPSLDRLMFSTTAASADRPAGLLAGIAPITPSTGGTGANKVDAMASDLQALATAVAPVAGNGQIGIVAAPAQGVALALRVLRMPYNLMTSTALPTGTVVSIAFPTLVTALEGAPEISTSKVALIHEETQPAAIVDIGGVVAHPVRSIFQTDTIAVKVRQAVSWALRSSSGLAWTQNTVW
jgi:Phage capsid family